MRELQIARAEAGMSLVELAKRSGVHYVTISDIEKGKRKAQTATLTKLARALNVPVSKFFPEEGPKVPGPLRSLDLNQRRAVMRYVTEQRMPPAISGDMKWLGTLKRAVAAAGIADEEFRAWARGVEPDEIRSILIPEDRRSQTTEEAFANA